MQVSGVAEQFREYMQESLRSAGSGAVPQSFSGGPQSSLEAAGATFRNELSAVQKSPAAAPVEQGYSPMEVAALQPAGESNAHLSKVQSIGDRILSNFGISDGNIGGSLPSGATDGLSSHVSPPVETQSIGEQGGSVQRGNIENPYLFPLHPAPSGPPSAQLHSQDASASGLKDAFAGLSGADSPSIVDALAVQTTIAEFRVKEAVLISSSAKINQEVSSLAKTQ